MYELAYITATFCGLAIDPVLWLPVVIAAYRRRPWWLPTAVGIGAAAVDDVLVAIFASARWDGHWLMPRILTGAVIGLIVIGVRALLRRFRRDPFA